MLLVISLVLLAATILFLVIYHAKEGRHPDFDRMTRVYTLVGVWLQFPFFLSACHYENWHIIPVNLLFVCYFAWFWRWSGRHR